MLFSLVNYRPDAVGIHNRTANPANVEDNVFVNLATPILGQASAANNLLLTLEEFFENAAPVAANDSASLDAGDALTIAVLANDADPDGDALSLAGIGSAGNGSVVDNGDGTLTYAPDSGFVGDDNFTYTIDDGQGGSDSATVAVTVVPAPAPAPPSGDLAPDQIAGLRLWLDAAASATLIDSNGDGRLNRWLDKSGNGHTATAPSGSQQPGLAGGLVFDGSNDVLAVGDAGDLNLASTTTAKTLTLAFTTGADVAGRQVLYEQGGSQRGLNLYIEDGEVHVGGWNLPENGWGPAFVGATVAAGTTYVATLAFDTAAGTISGMLNGASIGSIGGVGTLHKHGADIGLGRMQEDSLFESGAAGGDGFGFGGTLHEIALHNRVLDGGEQVGLHGHLLDKWTAPPPASLTPDQIAGLNLWLDGADAATLVDSNGDGRMNRWLDKSGAGHTAVAPGGSQQPVLAEGAAFDGNDVLAPADAGDLNLASSATAKTLTLVFSTGADVAGRQVLYEQGGAQRGLSFYIEDGEVHLGGWNLPEASWGPAFVTAGVAANTSYVATLTYNPTAGTLSGTLNGAEVGSIGGIGPLHKHGADIGLGRMNEDSLFESGAAAGDGFGFAGTLHEAAFYNRALGSQEQAGLASHLAEKWGIDKVQLLGIGSEPTADDFGLG